jgi:hypothetical protein
MAMTVVGAGLGRTGTNSLKVALERLLDGRCYHMIELLERPEDTEHWQRAAAGEIVDWGWLRRGFVATVDFPAAMFWREPLAANPDAFVLLSTRDSPRVWWDSFERTIVPSLSGEVPADRPDWARRRTMNLSVLSMFTPDWREPEAAIAAYERHNAEVRGAVPAQRLIDWRPGDSWEPICAALGLAVPAEPFPHENTTAAFQSRAAFAPPETGA